MSPQWRSNPKGVDGPIITRTQMFQSPQGGGNSKEVSERITRIEVYVSVPTMVEVNSTVCYLRTDICTLGIGYHNLAVPSMGK